MRKTIYIAAHIPPWSEAEFLQYIRDYDLTRGGCHFEIIIDEPDAKMSEVFDKARAAQEQLGLPLFGVVRKPK